MTFDKMPECQYGKQDEELAETVRQVAETVMVDSPFYRRVR